MSDETLDLNNTKVIMGTFINHLKYMENDNINKYDFIDNYFRIALSLSFKEYFDQKESIIKYILDNYDNVIIKDVIKSIDDIKDVLSFSTFENEIKNKKLEEQINNVEELIISS